MSVAVDTQVLIWAVKNTATAGRTHMIPRARQLIELLERNGDRIIVPSLVLSEFLVRYEPPQRASVLEQVTQRFFVPVFDVAAAALAAELFSHSSIWKPIRDQGKNTRQCVKVDISILATVEVVSPRVFYLEDDELHALAVKYQDANLIQVPLARLPSNQRDRADDE